MSGYAICRRCSAVYPAQRGCSACESHTDDQPLAPAGADPYVVAADPPIEPLARRVQKVVRRSPTARWFLSHAVTLGLLVLATVTLIMVVIRAGS